MGAHPLPPLHRLQYEGLVRTALAEDLGVGGDLTTDAIVPVDTMGTAQVIFRAGGRVAGLDVAAAAFLMLEPAAEVRVAIGDGDDAMPGQHVATVRGRLRGILTAERVALNFLAHMSGIATATRDTVAAVASYPVRVAGTRKTTPTLRALEKYAVRAGGGSNHRFGLDDAVLVKDNHIALAGGVSQAVQRARAAVGHAVKIEVEVDTLAQLEQALASGVDGVLLDNMGPDMLADAVSMVDGRAITEASGGIRPSSAAAIAATGVDVLSVGWLTSGAPAVDVALDVTEVD